jgi:hypothetical protein
MQTNFVKSDTDARERHLHDCPMAKVLILLVSVAMTWALVASFGWVAIAVCFALALASLMFSTEDTDVETVRSGTDRDAHYFAQASTNMGSL